MLTDFAPTRLITFLLCSFAAMFLIVSTASADPSVGIASNGNLKVTGGSEASNIVLTSSGGNLTVENPGHTLSSTGGPCLVMPPDSDTVTCLYAGLLTSNAQISLGSGWDSVDVDSSFPVASTVIVTGVAVASSDGAPLDVTTDDDGGVAIVVDGGPSSDRISVESPSSCFADVDGGGDDDEIYVDIGYLECESDIPESPLTGGDGDDLVDAQQSAAGIQYLASGGHDVFMGGSGHDHITVGDGPDWAFGGPGNDRMYDNGGPDPSKLWGGPGNDVFTDWDRSVNNITFFDGGSGTDKVAYRTAGYPVDVNVSLDSVTGDGPAGEQDNIKRSVEQIGDPVYGATGIFDGNDVLTGSDARNIITGYVGDDSIDGLGGNDTLDGSAGDDTIAGGAGLDSIYGDSGLDTLFGDAGADSINGAAGDDEITGGAGMDSILGGDDDDEIFAEDSEIDTIYCGAGDNDVVHADPDDAVDEDCELEL